MHVTKVVYLFAKIPEQLSLNFYYFSTIFKRIYKFAIFQNKRKRKWKLASRRLELCFLLTRGPWTGLGTEEGTAALFPARRVTGGGGP